MKEIINQWRKKKEISWHQAWRNGWHQRHQRNISIGISHQHGVKPGKKKKKGSATLRRRASALAKTWRNQYCY